MCIKSIKNIQSNGYIFKICSNIKLKIENKLYPYITTNFVTKLGPMGDVFL